MNVRVRLGAGLCMGLGLVMLLAACEQPASESAAATASPSGPMTVERRRDWAARLRADGLDEQALLIYEDLLRDGRGLSDKAIVGTSVIVADIHIEERRYEQALASLYRAALFEPKGDLARQIDEKKILCFERLGRVGAADRLLDKAAALDGAGEGGAGDDVIATIGEEKITRNELDSVIAASPPELQAQLGDKSRRLEVLKSLVASRVLERKADKLGVEKDPKVRLAMAAAAREIKVRKVIADEIRDKVEVKEDEAKLYYEAHPERFKEPTELAISHILLDDAAQEPDVRARLEREPFAEVAREVSRDLDTRNQGGVIEEKVVEGQYHPDFVNVADLLAAVGDTPAGQVAKKSLVTAKGVHIIEVRERKDGRRHPFEEVAEQASRMLRAERERAAVQEMYQAALTGSDIKIFEDRL